MTSKVLFCVTGLTPQIVTETLYALCVQQQPAWVPDKVVVMTTAEGKKRILEQLLMKEGGQFAAFCANYNLKNRIEFDESCIVLALDSHGELLVDVRTEQDNVLAGNAIAHTVQDLVAHYDAVHVSIAGGRKTMGFYAGSALSLYGRPQDRMSHVLVNEPFEQAPAFYFPPAIAAPVVLREGGTLSSSEARIMLADMPFLRLGRFLPPNLLGERLSFANLVSQLQDNLSTTWLSLDAQRFTLRTPAGEVKLRPVAFTVYAWFAMAKKYQWAHGGAMHSGDPLIKLHFLAFFKLLCMGQPAFNRTRIRLSSDDSFEFKVFSQFLSENLSEIRKSARIGLGYGAFSGYDVRCKRGDAGSFDLREIETPESGITLCAVLETFAKNMGLH